ncbi:MAG: TonB-dependent receptor [Puniceicoccaceae bacterium]|nr:MAG: TonB-dependent receptor [Puniceicoccaceae bacterium]
MDKSTAESPLLTTNRKALTINLDASRYGTFAEIGAGQEVARCFFQAGGAAGTIAKSISAYDMNFSDAIYGKTRRYVSRDRLSTMLDHEYALLLERLADSRPDSQFFVFANTVAAKSFRNPDGHGWLGIRFQHEPGSPANDIVIHVRLWDKENLLQQQALGIIGVNLVYGANYYSGDPARLIQSLIDNLDTDRIEVDMVHFSGPAFDGRVDNRLLSLLLVQRGLTNAVMFSPAGEVLQPAEALYKKSVLVQRGSFRPITRVNLDMLRCSSARFAAEGDPEAGAGEVINLMEITMNNLLVAGELDRDDFLARVDTITTLGHHVLVSNYFEFYRLSAYFRRYTAGRIGLVMGINTLLEVFQEKYYDHLPGGILESFGRLFRQAVKVYVYPMRQASYAHYLQILAGEEASPPEAAADENDLITAENVLVAPHLRHLYAHLSENHFIEGLTGYDPGEMDFFSKDALAAIHEGSEDWEQMVPPAIIQVIRDRGLFGWAHGARS